MPLSSLADRLQVKRDRTLALVDRPPGLELDASLESCARAEDVDEADVVVTFVRTPSDLRRRVPALATRLKPAAILWACYPKLTSPLAGELSRDIVYELMLALGWKANAQVAVNHDWSALRFRPHPAAS